MNKETIMGLFGKKKKTKKPFWKNTDRKKFADARWEYIEGGIAKEGADEKAFYRRVFAVETNELDELAVIKSTTVYTTDDVVKMKKRKKDKRQE